jgi:hypothetical protein
MANVVLFCCIFIAFVGGLVYAFTLLANAASKNSTSEEQYSTYQEISNGLSAF